MPSGNTEKKLIQSLYWTIIISFVSIIFLLDISVSKQIGWANLYIFPIILTVFLTERKKEPLLLDGLCCILIGVGLLVKLHDQGSWTSLFDRIISAVSINFGTFLAIIYVDAMLKRSSSEKRFSVALEGAPNGILLVESHGIISFANQQIIEMFGYPRKELLGKNVDLLVPSKYRENHAGHRANFLKDPKTRVMGAGRDLFGLRKDGTEFPIEIGLTPLENEGGVFVMATIVDISERKAQELALVQLNRDLLVKDQERAKIIDELTESNQALDDFAYITSHDLKEPLRGVTNHARFIQEDYKTKLDSEGVNRLERMTYLCHRMEGLINDLLYFSRLGTQKLAIQKTNLKTAIQEIESMMEFEGNVEIRVASNLPEIECDRARITEVFRNLITNAIKYNNKPKKIIEIGWLESKQREHQLIKNVFFVKDNGIGIPSEFYEDIFKLFKRLNSELEEVKGSGVGLTFVKKIIERHGGQIWLESIPGQGTTFFFSLDGAASI